MRCPNCHLPMRRISRPGTIDRPVIGKVCFCKDCGYIWKETQNDPEVKGCHEAEYKEGPGKPS